jgi:hypothetical protein
MKKRKKKHVYRQNKRVKERENGFSRFEERPRIKAKYINNATFIESSISMEASGVTKTGFTALKDKNSSKKLYKLKDLVGEKSDFKFRLQEWDGQLSTPFNVSLPSLIK